MILGVKTEKDPSVLEFISKTNERLKNQLFLKGILRFKSKENQYFIVADLYVMQFISPLWIAGLAALVLIYFLGWTWLLLFPLFIASISLLTTRHFFFAVFYRGLRKEGYSGNISFLKYDELFRGWLG